MPSNQIRKSITLFLYDTRIYFFFFPPTTEVMG